jgi:hypothetical protein
MPHSREQNRSRRSVWHVSICHCASLMRPTHIGPVCRTCSANSSRLSAGAWMRTLSKSGSTKDECSRCERDQNGAIHVVPPYFGLRGLDRLCVLTEGYVYSC